MSRMLEVSVSKKAILRYHLAADLPPVEVDISQLNQIIMNLVINASEALGDQSGVISLSSGVMECDHAYLAATWLKQDLPEGVYVFLEVADTGCGMTPEILERIFDPFFTTKFTGRGLGLAAVLGIVRGHRGTIKIYSEPGRGTTFKVLLPATHGTALPVPKNNIAPHLWHGTGTILLVDDEETVRHLSGEMLERLGFRVLTAANGQVALELFKTHASEIRAVLLDLTMPIMDGTETFRELRRFKADIPVIMSSGYNEQEITQRFSGKGLAGFIQKPYNLTTLSEILRAALETGPSPAVP